MASDVISVLDGDFNAYLLTPTEKINVIEKAPTVEAAVNALRQAVSSDSLKTDPAIVVCNGTYILHRNCVEALQKAGFTNVESMNPFSVVVTSSIAGLPLNCAIDEPVLVFHTDVITVIKKCETGWQYVETTRDISAAFNRHPSVRNAVMLEETPKYTTVRKNYPHIKIHPLMGIEDFYGIFIRLHISEIYQDNEVWSCCSVDLYLTFGNRVDTIKLRKRLPPFTITEEYDIGDVSEVKTFALLPGQVGKAVTLPTVKIFNFKTKAFRNVVLTVSVDKTLLPQVTLKTISTYEPTMKPNPGIFVVEHERKTYYLRAVYPDHKTIEGSFETADELAAYMIKHFSMATTSIVYFIDFSPNSGATKPMYFVTESENMRNELRDFRTTLQQAGFSDVRFIPSESVHLSLLLDFAQVTVKPDQLIAVFDSYKYRIIRRDGKCLKIIERDDSPDFDVKKSKVTTIVIDNSIQAYTKTDLDYLRAKFSSCAVYAVSEMEALKKRLPKYLWSLANETDFGGNIFNNFSDFEFAVEEHGTITEKIDMGRFARLPYVLTITYLVQFTDTLHLHLGASSADYDELGEYSVTPGNVVRFTITVESVCDITVRMNVLKPDEIQWAAPKNTLRELPLPASVPKSQNDKKEKKKKVVEIPEAVEPKNTPSTTDATVNTVNAKECLPKQLSELRLDPPNAIFTFTSDNRVLIEVDETYSGVKEVLAYVRLRVGKEPQVGTKAFDALKKHPASVFYGITRLFATDFDPDHPDPSWGFKTARDADGKVVIRSADDITTFPIVLFGLVIQSTLLYVREHTKSDVKSIGLKLPTGSTVSPDELKEVSKRIGVELSLIVTFS